jgi:hypothetical protein
MTDDELFHIRHRDWAGRIKTIDTAPSIGRARQLVQFHAARGYKNCFLTYPQQPAITEQRRQP